MKLFPEIVFRNRVIAGVYCGLISLPIVLPLSLGLVLLDKSPISGLVMNVALAALVAALFGAIITPIYKYFAECNKRKILPIGIGSRAVFSLSASMIITVLIVPSQVGEYWLYTLQNFIFISILANACDSAMPKAKLQKMKLQGAASQSA